jgi:hypothetical protein
MANVTIATSNAYDCTPSSLVASNPCLACLPEKTLLAALVGVIAIAAEKEQAALLVDSACFMCLSEKQMLQALVTIVGNDMLTDSTVQDVIDEYHCLVCASQKQLLAALLYLLCNEVTFTIGRQ